MGDEAPVPMSDAEILRSICNLSVPVLVSNGPGAWINNLMWALSAAAFQHHVPLDGLIKAITAQYKSLSETRVAQ